MIREQYQHTPSREEKTQITEDIIGFICKRGRFLKFDQGTKLWSILTKEDAHKKVAHALRNIKNPTRQPRTKTTCNKTFPKIYIDNDATKQGVSQERAHEENPVPDDFVIDFSIIDEIACDLDEFEV
jgi:hypothetical protein